MGIENMITCGVCHKKLVHARFSNTSINKYKQNVQYQARSSGKGQAPLPTCRSCTPGSRTELTCVDCHRTMDLDSFSKVQRRNPDNARCVDCQQAAEDREPDTEAAIAEVEECERLAYQSATGSTYDRSTLASQFSQVRISGHQGELKGNTDGTSDGGADNWLEQGSSRKDSNRGGSQGMGSRGNGRNGPLSPTTNVSQSSTPSTTNQSIGTWAGFVQSPRPTSRVSTGSTSRRGGSNPGFAKQGAFKESITDKATRRHERETRLAREYGKAENDEVEKSDSDSSEFEL